MLSPPSCLALGKPNTLPGRPPALVAIMAVAATFLAFSLLPAGAASAPAAGAVHRKAVVVLIPAVSPADLSEAVLPNLSAILAGSGSVALLNSRTAGGATLANACVTLSAGSRGLAPAGADEVMMASELVPRGDPESSQPVPVVFTRRIGLQAPDTGLVVLNEPALLATNAANDHPTAVGAFADALREEGLRIAYLGDDDTSEAHRPGGLFAADSRGLIQEGLAGSALHKKDPSVPWGIRTDYSALKRAFDRFYPRADVLVIEAGDLARIDTYASLGNPVLLAAFRSHALRQVDSFLGWLWQQVDSGPTRLFVVGPLPDASASRMGIRFGFFVIAGRGIQPGLLKSPSTRWAGICTNTDVAPTILSWLKVPIPAAMMGEPVFVQPLSRAFPAGQFLRADNEPPPGIAPRQQAQLAWLREEANRLAALTNLRPAFLKTYVYIQIGVVVAILTMAFWPNAAPPRPVLRLFSYLLLALISYPLALLLGGWAVSSLHPWLMAGIVAGITLVLPFIARLFARGWQPLGAFIWICLATVVAVAADSMTGWHMIRSSPLGYDAQAGARYYGIGNEYMGVMFGATISSLGAAWQWWDDRKKTAVPSGNWASRLIWSLPLWALIGILGDPSWGAKVGSILVGLTALVAWAILPGPGYKPDYSRLLIVLFSAAALAVFILVGVAAWDATRPLPSHLGRLWLSVQANGPAPFLDTVQRKLAMDWQLMHSTYWSGALLAFLAALLAMFFFRPAYLWDPLLSHRPHLAHALQVSLLAAAAALVLNDAGVVAAATLTLYPASMLFALWCWAHLQGPEG